MQTSDWAFFGFILMTAILIIVTRRMEVSLNNKRLEKLVEAGASEEFKEILLSHLFRQKHASLRTYYPLLVSALSVGMIFAHPFFETKELMTIFGCLFLLSLIFHLFELACSIELLVSAVSKRHWCDERTTLKISDFMTKEQIELLLVKMKTENSYRNDSVYSLEVYLPDLMFKFLQRKEEINEYIELEKMDSSTSEKSDHMTKEQRARRRIILTEYYESLESLRPVVTDILNATSQDFYEYSVEKRKNSQINKQEIQQEIEEVQTDFEQRLMKLNQGVGFREKHSTINAQIPEAIRELQRVAQSEQVSDEKKVEATELIQLIIEKRAKEKSEHEKEMVEMDAESVIKASKLFYGIDATTTAREQVNA